MTFILVNEKTLFFKLNFGLKKTYKTYACFHPPDQFSKRLRRSTCNGQIMRPILNVNVQDKNEIELLPFSCGFFGDGSTNTFSFVVVASSDRGDLHVPTSVVF